MRNLFLILAVCCVLAFAANVEAAGCNAGGGCNAGSGSGCNAGGSGCNVSGSGNRGCSVSGNRVSRARAIDLLQSEPAAPAAPAAPVEDSAARARKMKADAEAKARAVELAQQTKRRRPLEDAFFAADTPGAKPLAVKGYFASK